MEKVKDIEQLLPDRIRSYRQKRGLTQAQLSELVDVTEHYIAEIENALKFPSMELIKNISTALNVPIYCLMQTEENVDLSRCAELRNMLEQKDEKELSTILDVLLTINKLSKE